MSLFVIQNSEYFGNCKEGKKFKLPLKQAKDFSVSGAFSNQGNKSMCAKRGLFFLH